MAELIININKPLQQSAEAYFQRAKKLKRKQEGIQNALQKFNLELYELENKKEESLKRISVEAVKSTVVQVPKKWFHAFHWFYSSEGFLCVGGRGADSNDLLIRNYLEPKDLVFHTEQPGSPFFLIKTNGKTIGDQTLQETALATASYSRAWKTGLKSTDVYMINADQVKKDLSLPKGSFMIYGKRTYFKPILQLAVGIKEDGEIIGGPLTTVQKYAKSYFMVDQGEDKTTDAAKKIQKHLGGGVDDIVKFLPAGGCKVVKVDGGK